MFYDKDGNRRLPRAYLAGFGVFRENEMEFGMGQKEIALRYGIDGLWPHEPDPNPGGPYITKDPDDLYDVMRPHFIRDVDHVLHSDMIIADLNFFRGFEPDSGTAFECGMIRGLDRMCYAFVDKMESLKDLYDGETYTDKDGVVRAVDTNQELYDYGSPLNPIFGCFKVIEGSFEDCCKAIEKDLKQLYKKEEN